MHARQQDMLFTLISAQDFLDRNAARLAGVITTGARQMLGTSIAELSVDASVQLNSGISAKLATAQVHALRHALIHDHMEHIAHVARAQLPKTADLSALRIPKGKLGITGLIAAARGMAGAAAPYAAQLITVGLPSDFIARLNAAADAYLAAATDRVASKNMKKEASTSLKNKLSGARRVLNILNVFVKTASAHDKGLLSAWHQAIKVQKAPGTGGIPVPTPVTPTVPGITTAPAPATPPATATETVPVSAAPATTSAPSSAPAASSSSTPVTAPSSAAATAAPRP